MASRSISARTCVLVAAGRADWEPAVLTSLSEARIVVVRRCVDIVDLVANARAGTSDIAVVAADLDGIDTESLRQLRASGVGVVAVGGSPADRDRLTRLAVPSVADPAEVVGAVEARLASGQPRPMAVANADDPDTPDDGGPAGRVVAVWGAPGAPGRSTVAAALAAERATASRVVLCDLDPYAGTLAQTLGVVEETSGLLTVARAVNEGVLDAAFLASILRAVDPGLELLSGLPRADRWAEVRPGVVEALVVLAAGRGDVVLDCGFGAGHEDSAVPSPARVNTDALAAADRVVVVGSAEPTALARLAHALVELGDAGVAPGGPPWVVVNRMRASLGWRPDDVISMIDKVAPGARVYFWPYERATLDRASLRAVSLPGLGDSPLRDCAREMLPGLFDQVPKSR